MTSLVAALRDFSQAHHFNGKGSLCVALVVTRHAQEKGLPLNPDTLLTQGGGQVLDLGRTRVQTILNQHGITRTLAAEGGRTSRGSIGNMREYVAFLNERHARFGAVDLNAIEKFWIEHVQAFFAAKPFKIHLDVSKSLRALVRDVLAQAEDRQRRTPGMQYVGAVLQHLVGAKLDCALGGGITHHGFSTSDAPSGRSGDFSIADVVIHVTSSPGDLLIEKCRDNIHHSCRPMIVTTTRGLTVAEVLTENAGLGDRVDVFEIEQFIALNLYEFGKFTDEGRRIAIGDVVTRYNQIVDEFETDPSLKIEFRS
ncbi:hypothetical protein AGMMS49545_08890 [Betaproteobacteria bacterium]|nr:hypothetical protein AGMMS49545_08890 [Betaproteobacteria bacterium]GHU43939.1 hypothetical protein AGMMS50289_11230 [Betaproteobacteria bacterium]